VTNNDPYALPPDLPVPEDDGGADHLTGSELPHLTLESSQGPVDVAELDVPGARGCTPQSCGFRDHAAELAELGASRIAGVSTQTLDEQIEFAERNHMPFPVIADPKLELRDALRLPTFEIQGHTLYKRLALIAVGGWIAKVFYPVFPPDRSAQDVVDWLRATEGE
jgi:peroxiredoxin